LILKLEFVTFVKNLFPPKENPFTESEVGDLFLLFCKRLDPN
jgi:hypothetical protein